MAFRSFAAAALLPVHPFGCFSLVRDFQGSQGSSAFGSGCHGPMAEDRRARAAPRSSAASSPA